MLISYTAQYLHLRRVLSTPRANIAWLSADRPDSSRCLSLAVVVLTGAAGRRRSWCRLDRPAWRCFSSLRYTYTDLRGRARAKGSQASHAQSRLKLLCRQARTASSERCGCMPWPWVCPSAVGCWAWSDPAVGCCTVAPAESQQEKRKDDCSSGDHAKEACLYPCLAEPDTLAVHEFPAAAHVCIAMQGLPPSRRSGRRPVFMLKAFCILGQLAWMHEQGWVDAGGCWVIPMSWRWKVGA